MVALITGGILVVARIFRLGFLGDFLSSSVLVGFLTGVVEGAPDPVRWLVLDASTLGDVDYSAGLSFSGLLDYLEHHKVTFALARADSSLLDTLRVYGLDARIPDAHVFANLDDAVAAFRTAPTSA